MTPPKLKQPYRDIIEDLELIPKHYYDLPAIRAAIKIVRKHASKDKKRKGKTK